MSERERPLSVVVVDDDDLSRRRIRDLLSDRQGFRLVAECSSAEEALETIRSERPDLLFLDIEMPDVDGYELLDRLEEPRPHVIVMTAHERYALRGFDENAVDFLLKPYDRRRFETALERGTERVRSGELDALLGRLREVVSERAGPGADPAGNSEDRPLRKLVVRSQHTKRLVDTADIRWIEAADYYARLHTGSRSHLLRRSLSWLEENLDPDRFVRIHRSSIVNVDHVREIVPWSGGSYNVLLADGTELRMVASRKGELEKLLGQSL